MLCRRAIRVSVRDTGVLLYGTALCCCRCHTALMTHNQRQELDVVVASFSALCIACLSKQGCNTCLCKAWPRAAMWPGLPQSTPCIRGVPAGTETALVHLQVLLILGVDMVVVMCVLHPVLHPVCCHT